MVEVGLITTAVVLALFGVALAALGMSSERAYWSQRDPRGNARAEATRFSAIARRAFPIAVSDDRAPLRIVAIGVVLIWVALAFAIAALVFWVV
ncbi:MAG: hypothetical protein R2737_11300 [Candidatus Nanopelagicales bacterium]